MTDTNTTIPRTPYEVVEWGKQRNDVLQARGDAALRIANSLIDARIDGRAAGHEHDLLVALVRMTALAADCLSLSRQVVEACAEASVARHE